MNTPRISSYYLHWLHDYLREHGVEPAWGALPAQEEMPFINMTEWRKRLDQAATLLDDSDLGLHFGLTITPQRFGVLGYLLHHCDNFGQALMRLQHFRPLFFQLQHVTITRQDKGSRVAWRSDDGPPHYQEEVFSLVATLQFARKMTGQALLPAGVGLMSTSPGDTRALQDFMGCTLLFAEEKTWLEMPSGTLALPNVRPDAGLRALLEKQAEAMLATLPAGDELVQAVRRHIAALLQEGEPTLERVAEQLNISSRTLHRRLLAQNSRFRDVLEQTRRQLAEAYLRDPRLSLADIALLLGYAEQSPFTHAFKRWTGSTPFDWRRQLVAKK